jgi:hypothetical protein
MADHDAQYLTNVITSNWAMPPESLFDSAILPVDPSEAWPLPLLRSLADLSTLTALNEDLNNCDEMRTFTRARDLLNDLCIARVEALGDYERAVEIDAGTMTEGDVEVVIGLLGGRPKPQHESGDEDEEEEQVKEDEQMKEWEEDIERAEARDRRRRAIARPRRISRPTQDVVSESSRVDYHRIRQRASSMEDEDHLDTLPDPIPDDDFNPLPEPIRPFGQQYRLQTPRQPLSSSRTVSRISRWDMPPPPSHIPSRRSPNTHTSSLSVDGAEIENSDTEPSDASPGIFASDAYPPGSVTAERTGESSGSDSTISQDDAAAEHRRRDREYRDLQLDIKELRTQQAWDEKELRICRLKRKIHAIEDEREDEELLREEKRRRV